MTIKTRFAPSPTGNLHVGSARTALIVWLFTRKNDGKFLLRIDDTDLVRSKKEYEANIIAGMEWLGMDWDDMVHQVDRNDIYNVAIQKLKDSGRLYPCYETEEELALKRKSLLSRSLPPIYDREALTVTDEQKAKYEAEGRSPHWRFKLNHKHITWNDLVRGKVDFHGKDLSDPVMIRADGRPLYHISSVIDDIEFKITHIVRGEDHVANSAVHIQMFEAFGAKPPEFAHLSLLGDMSGLKLSKRKGAGDSGLSLSDDGGLEKMALVSLISRMGTSDPIEPIATMQEVIDNFDFSKFSRNLPKFDEEELYRLNRKIIHKTEFKDVEKRLKDMGLNEVDEIFWNIVRPNLETINDIKEWWDITHTPVEPAIKDPELMVKAAELLPDEPWDNSTWDIWITKVKKATDRKGKNLFKPLREVLTGQEAGPELKELLPIIGKERALRRLKKAS